MVTLRQPTAEARALYVQNIIAEHLFTLSGRDAAFVGFPSGHCGPVSEADEFPSGHFVAATLTFAELNWPPRLE